MTISPEMDLSGYDRPMEGERQELLCAGLLTDESYREIGDLLHQQQGFRLNGYKKLHIERRIAGRIRMLGLPGQDAYLELLKKSRREQQQLLDSVSVHVSHFFRNPSTFKVLEQRVLPELIDRSAVSNGTVRVWSIGCSTGEEPYTLAMLGRGLDEVPWPLTIFGTDLSRTALQKARQGCYDPGRLREVPARLKKRFFICREDRYCLTDEVKKMVRFFRHDLLTDKLFCRAELVLCRNVMIYFSRRQQRQIQQRLAAALSPGGYLVLGRAETLVPACRGLFHCIDPAERIYQRLEPVEIGSTVHGSLKFEGQVQ